ncbi:MAG TPA: GNAT family N-acetyltransferase [Thermomicrobiales bacterium]
MPEPRPAPAFTLRPVTAEDYSFLYDLHVAAMKEYVAQTWGWDEAVQQAMFRENFTPERSQIVMVDGRAVGVFAAERRPAEWFVWAIAIGPEMQGQGLGATLLRDLLATAARDALPTRLQVLRVNLARRLYERLGFAVVGETPTHYLMLAPAHTLQQQCEEG